MYAFPKAQSAHQQKTKQLIQHSLNPSFFFEIETPANDRIPPGDFDRRGEMSVRVRKGGFMV